jgi:hypothetical protein
VPPSKRRILSKAREPLNNSPLGRRRLCGMGMRERRRREWYDRGGRSSVFRRKMRPRSGMQTPQQVLGAVLTSPPLPDPCFAGSLGLRSGGVPFARSLTKQAARKGPSHPGCGKIGCSWRCAPWHRSPGYDLRRAPYDHPDFTGNASSENLFSDSPNLSCSRKIALSLAAGSLRHIHLLGKW